MDITVHVVQSFDKHWTIAVQHDPDGNPPRTPADTTGAEGRISSMPTIRETITTSLPADEAFAFVADFANAPVWDPGTATSHRLDDGPVGVGSRYRLEVRMGRRLAPMTYRIVEHEPSRRVVLRGEGSSVRATDEISFDETPIGTRIEYVADIHLSGLLRLAEPLLGGAFRKIGRQARDGMQRALADRAAGTTARPGR
jgi:carbon monoxide dehydrogenase subunit G